MSREGHVVKQELSKDSKAEDREGKGSQQPTKSKRCFIKCSQARQRRNDVPGRLKPEKKFLTAEVSQLISPK